MSDIGTHAPQLYGQNPPSQQKFQFNEEEKRVIAECRNESFWYRSMPLSLAAGGLTRYLISRGILTTGTRFGAAPKIIVAGITGFLGGRISYMGKCQEKFLRLENSPVADALRQNRERKMRGVPAIPPGLPAGAQQPTYRRASKPQESDDFGGVSLSGYQSDDAHSNMDIDTSNVKTVDDYPILLEDEESGDVKPEMTTTYQELRQKNRSTRPIYHSQYSQTQVSQAQQQQPPQGNWQPQTQPPAGRASQQQQQRAQDEEFPLGRSMKKNQYGDVWEG